MHTHVWCICTSIYPSICCLPVHVVAEVEAGQMSSFLVFALTWLFFSLSLNHSQSRVRWWGGGGAGPRRNDRGGAQFGKWHNCPYISSIYLYIHVQCKSKLHSINCQKESCTPAIAGKAPPKLRQLQVPQVTSKSFKCFRKLFDISNSKYLKTNHVHKFTETSTSRDFPNHFEVFQVFSNIFDILILDKTWKIMMLVKNIATIENYIQNAKKRKKTANETVKIFLDNFLTFSSLNFSKTKTTFLLSYFVFEVLNHFVHTSRKQRTKRKNCFSLVEIVAETRKGEK